jgi:hypothetical protein
MRDIRAAAGTTSWRGAMVAVLVLLGSQASAQQLLPALGTFDAMGDVNASAIQSNGATIAGGRFDKIAGATGQQNLVRFNAAGVLEAWAPNPDGRVYDVLVDAQGRIYAAGQFSTIAGQSRPGLARFLPGTEPVLDFAYVPQLPTGALADAIALRSDGSLYVSYTQPGISGARIARIDATGALVPGFTVTANFAVFAMTLSADESKLFVAGAMNQINGTNIGVGSVAKLDANTGALDADWIPFTTGTGRVRAILLDGSTHVILGGTIPGGTEGLARVSVSAPPTVDVTWGPDFTSLTTATTITDLLRFPDGDVFASGDFETVDGESRPGHVAKLAPDGSLRSGWGATTPIGGMSTGATAMSAAGIVSLPRYAGPPRLESAMFKLALADGAAVPGGLINATFLDRADFQRFAVQPGTGRIFAAGAQLRIVDGRSSHGAVALLPNLSVDTGWNSGLASQVSLGGTVAIGASTNAVFLGGFGFRNDSLRTIGLYRVAGSDGAVTAWQPLTAAGAAVGFDVPSSIAVDEVGGYVYTINLNRAANNANLPGRPLVRFSLITGLADSTWQPVISGITSPTAQLRIDGSHLYVSGIGSIATNDASLAFGIARLPLAGTGAADATFKPYTATTAISTFDLSPTHAYVGGNGILARIDRTTGIVDPAWSPLPAGFGSITQISLADDGSVYLVGTLAAACSGALRGAVRVTSGGVLDTTWGLDADNAVNSILGLPGGRSLVAGFFRNVNGEARDGLAALGRSDMIFVDGSGDRTCVTQ